MKIKLLPRKDYDQFLEHLIRLNHASKLDRFGHTATTTWLQKYINEIPDEDFVLGAHVEGGELIGAIHISRLDQKTEGILEAEFGISVLEDYRKRGVGSHLIEAAVQLCRGLDFKFAWILIHEKNDAMKHLARKFNAEVKTRMGEVFARIPI